METVEMLKYELRELFREFDSDMQEECFEHTGLGDKDLADLDEAECITILNYIRKARTMQGEDVTDMHDKVDAIKTKYEDEQIVASEKFSEMADKYITELLKNKDILNGVLAAIPDGWEYSELSSGSNPTTFCYAYAWMWEKINKHRA